MIASIVVDTKNIKIYANTFCHLLFWQIQNDNLTYSCKLIQRAWGNFRMKVIKRDKINRPNQTCCYCNKSSTERGILFPFSLLHRVKKNSKEVSFLCMKNSVEMGTHILRDISQEFFANFCATLCRHILHSYKLCKLETNVKKIRRTVSKQNQ